MIVAARWRPSQAPRSIRRGAIGATRCGLCTSASSALATPRIERHSRPDHPDPRATPATPQPVATVHNGGSVSVAPDEGRSRSATAIVLPREAPRRIGVPLDARTCEASRADLPALCRAGCLRQVQASKPGPSATRAVAPVTGPHKDPSRKPVPDWARGLSRRKLAIGSGAIAATRTMAARWCRSGS
jgi:hypothetical protein